MSAPVREHVGAATLAPYEAIHAHAELELELAGRGDVHGLAALAERWERLTADLPPRPPAAAAPLLERAQLIHERTRIELLRLREALLSDAAEATARQAHRRRLRGPAPARPRVDRSA